MQQPQEPFARLRWLLAQRPSHKLFSKILRTFHEWRPDPQDQQLDDEFAMALQYTESHMTGWHDAYRTATPADCWPTMPQGAPGPVLRLVRQLKCRQISDVFNDLAPMFASEHVVFVNSLTLTQCNITPTQLDVLGQAAAMPHLTELDLSRNALGDEGIAHLVQWPALSQLRYLSVQCNRIREAGSAALASSEYLTQLDRLIMYNNELGNEGVEYLARAPNLAHLTHLDLSDNYIDEDGFIHLAESPYLTQLTYLDLAQNDISARGVGALINSPNAKQLKALYLQDGIEDYISWTSGDDIAYAVASCPNLGQLDTLMLRGNNISTLGERAIAHSEHLPISIRYPYLKAIKEA